VWLFEEWGLPIWKKDEAGKTLDGIKGKKMGTLKARRQAGSYRPNGRS